MRSARDGTIRPMPPLTQRLLLTTAAGTLRIVRRRVQRARSLRWAIRVPLVTLACMALAVGLGGLGAHPRGRRPPLR